MSKRSLPHDIEYYKNKIRKLEKRLRKCDTVTVAEVHHEPDQIELDVSADTPVLRPDDYILEWPDDNGTEDTSAILPESADKSPETVDESPESANKSPESEDIFPEGTDNANLDAELLEILGEDPSSNDNYGPEIRNELANRLLHLAKDGLTKEKRKEIIDKYLLPANCKELDAPKMNAEIKAACGEPAVKRDKGIEAKQKQLTSAIACICQLINTQLNSKTRDNEFLQKLMDVIRLLCDLQHADSVTRRNFILFTLKNDLKDHLRQTKIDTFLFGEDLPETLRSAKAVNKSGAELKADVVNKANPKFKATQRPLNRRAPPQQVRKQYTGTAPPHPAAPPRSREPAAARAPYHHFPPPSHPPPQAHSSKTSSQARHTTYSRRR